MKKISLKVNEDTLLGNAWEVENPIANVIIMQGMEEYSLRYSDFAAFLNENSINVYGLDCYGQGENVKDDLSKRSFWPKNGFEKMVDAYHAMAEEAGKNGAKTYVFAHSMGSFMAQMYIEKYPLASEKVVLCGSGGKNPAVPIAILLAKIPGNGKKRYEKAKLLKNLMFGNFNKKIENPKTEFDWLSYNKDNVTKYIDDPLCGFGCTNGFCYEFLIGMSKLYKKKALNNIDKNQKIFLISGEEDPVTNYGKFVNELSDMYTSLGINSVCSKVYPKARHEILFESCNKDVYKDVLNFFLN